MQSAKGKSHKVFFIKTTARVFTFAFCLLPFDFLSACPFCKEALNGGLAKGFYWSILWMLSVPVVVVGAISTVVWRAYRRGLEAKKD